MYSYDEKQRYEIKDVFDWNILFKHLFLIFTGMTILAKKREITWNIWAIERWTENAQRDKFWTSMDTAGIYRIAFICLNSIYYKKNRFRLNLKFTNFLKQHFFPISAI